ncbi:RICIN domain-containing protein [Streptomyces ortus]|uniref:RICIN domain-containing protein n=1 Tax=Streptomyces ortus TaxID=2867268 RepID=A0ABT3VIZ9_9ACTN|nr:RICIN domain-containing protein [Streptomyces ortus]MCX4238909.1 RICIN domain-containing protein [Streptomyces ortus]
MNVRKRAIPGSVLAMVVAAFSLLGTANGAQAAPAAAPSIVAQRTVTIDQADTHRFLDAHEIESLDFRVITRPFQNNSTQHWLLTDLSNGLSTIRQVSTGRYLDAYQGSGDDFRVVTRTAENDATQAWIILPSNNGTFTIQEASNSRYLDAYELSSQDFQVVTRQWKNADEERWRIIDV